MAGNIKGLAAGIYRYDWVNHSIRLVKDGGYRRDLAEAALYQRFIQSAPACIVIMAVYSRTTRKYGERGTVRYVHMDAGHAAENLFLQATALGLGTVTVGAFIDEEVKKVIGVQDEVPLCLMPLGWPRRP